MSKALEKINLKTNRLLNQKLIDLLLDCFHADLVRTWEYILFD